MEKRRRGHREGGRDEQPVSNAERAAIAEVQEALAQNAAPILHMLRTE